MRRIVFVFSVLIALALMAPVASAQATQSQLRVMHDSPDTSNVDVYVDGQRVFENVPYSTTSDYQPVAAGQHRVQVVSSGKSVDQALIDLTVDLTRDKPYTVVALGTQGEIQGKLLPDTRMVPEPGNARVRIVHAASGVATLDVYPSGSDIPLLTDQYFGSADYVNIPAGTYSFDLKPAGLSTTVLTSQPLKFEAGWVYSLVVTQPTGAGPLVRASVDRVGAGGR